MHLKKVASQLVTSSVLLSLVAATPLGNLESRNDPQLPKPKVFLIDLVSFRKNPTSCAELAHLPFHSSAPRDQPFTTSPSSTYSPGTSPSPASRRSFRTSTARPITMCVRSSRESLVRTTPAPRESFHVSLIHPCSRNQCCILAIGPRVFGQI